MLTDLCRRVGPALFWGVTLSTPALCALVACSGTKEAESAAAGAGGEGAIFGDDSGGSGAVGSAGGSGNEGGSGSEGGSAGGLPQAGSSNPTPSACAGIAASDAQPLIDDFEDGNSSIRGVQNRVGIGLSRMTTPKAR